MHHHSFSAKTPLRAAALVLTTIVIAASAFRSVREAPHPVPMILPERPAAVTAFVHVGVVPMDLERVLSDQTVVVADGHITALGPSGTTPVPAGAARVGGRGKFLIPGLADCHAHLREQPVSMPDRRVMKEQTLFLWLAHGLTTVRILDHGKNRQTEDLPRLRDRAAAGELLSPRIYTAGDLLGGLARPDSVQGPLQLDEVVEAVRTYQAAGYDFIKMHFYETGGIYRVEGKKAHAFDSVVAVARREGLPLGGHAMAPLARVLETYEVVDHLSGYLRGGAAHSYEMDYNTPLEELAPRMRELATATQRAGVWNCPTLSNSIRNDDDSARIEAARRLIKALQDAGAGLLLGSDKLRIARPFILGEELPPTPEARRLDALYGYAGATHRELREFVQSGLTPYQALAAGTRNMAAFFGALDSTGTVEVGKRADLVLLDGNPLADIGQTERIAGVMLGGRWLDRTELDRRIQAILAWSDRWCASAAAKKEKRYEQACAASTSDP